MTPAGLPPKLWDQIQAHGRLFAARLTRAAPPAPPPSPKPVRWCVHIGPAARPAACGCGGKAVRRCLHPLAPWADCVLGPATEPGVQSCATCPARVPLKSPPAPAATPARG